MTPSEIFNGVLYHSNPIYFQPLKNNIYILRINFHIYLSKYNPMRGTSTSLSCIKYEPNKTQWSKETDTSNYFDQT